MAFALDTTSFSEVQALCPLEAIMQIEHAHVLELTVAGISALQRAFDEQSKKFGKQIWVVS